MHQCIGRASSTEYAIADLLTSFTDAFFASIRLFELVATQSGK
jgi:hypothetical protein